MSKPTQTQIDEMVAKTLAEGKGTFTPEQLIEISRLYKEAENSDTPFAIVKDNEISVVGDPNDTSIKKIDMKIGFRMPVEVYEKHKFKAENPQRVTGYYIFEETFKDCYITPREDTRVLFSLLHLLPFFQKIRDENDGSLEFADKMDLAKVLAFAPKEITLAMYNVVGAFINIDDEVGEWMFPVYVYEGLAKFFKTYPEAINEADLFFGLSISDR